MNINLLKSKMALRGDRMQDLGVCLGVTVSAISNKINGKVEFSRVDVQKIIDRYGLTPDETHEIFF
jgi:hypothetical protein